MNPKLQKILKDIGFDSKEALVYLACLELAGAPASHIARKAGLNRITAYEVLKRLSSQGTVSTFEKGKIKHFVSIEPDVLIEQAAQRVAAAKHFLPEFTALANQHPRKPQIYFYEGIEGIKSIYADSLKAKSEILTFTNPADILELFGEHFTNNYVKERVRRGIRVRGLAPDDAVGRKEAGIGKKVLREVRLFSPQAHEIRNEVMLYDDTIAIFSGADGFGLVIKNHPLATTFRSIWEMAWKSGDLPKP